jgi:NAD(P)-dependent dehydrogenase (short-subunit alcohol dehydrogenase family)
MDAILKDKVITITGGTRGVGKGVAIGALKEGAKVVISGRKAADGKAALDEINGMGFKDIHFVQGEITRVEECERLIAETVAKFGRIDGLMNYAGILPEASLMETDEKIFDEVFAINIRTPFFLCKYAIREMLKTGSGSIVNICSPHAYSGDYDRAPYAVSKGALLTLTRHIARNYRKNQIRANSITMGWVATDGEMELRHRQGHDLAWLQEAARNAIPMGRLQTVEDHVPGILYLLSDLSSQVTNVELHVTGGMFHA